MGRMIRKTLVGTMVLTTLFGCATYRPIVDMSGKTQAQYNADVSACQQYAEQISPASSALVGGIIMSAFGAGMGAIMGSFFGMAGDGAAMGAAMGGGAGVAYGAAGGMQSQVDIIRRCMAGRGWNVLH